MAARLVYIKSVSLLPVYEEAEQLKKELTGELIEYRDCKIMAGKIAQTANGFDYFYRETMKIESSKKYERLHESDDLFRSYIAAIGKGKRKLPPPIEAFTAIVSKKIVSVSSRVSGIVTKLRKGAKRQFGEFFSDASSRSEMVATFLAMLELIKANKIKAWGSGDKVIVEQCEEVEGDISYIISEFSDGENGEEVVNDQ
jgi:segregation and condensation protein A